MSDVCDGAVHVRLGVTETTASYCVRSFLVIHPPPVFHINPGGGGTGTSLDLRLTFLTL